jgi:hypothetical protein
MAKKIEIHVNGKLADYKEAASLPLSLKVKADEYFKPIGLAATRVDNAARQIVFPGTVSNQNIFKDLRAAAAVSIRVNGSTLFDGKGAHKYTVKGPGETKGYSMALNSGASDLFGELRQQTLRGLEIGTSELTQANLQASWAGSYDTGHLAVWAPVYYGQTSDPANGFTVLDLRPHTYLAAINAAIWKRLKISVQSNLFSSRYFKNYVHIFGVGDQWSVGNTDAQEFDVFMAPLTPVAVPSPGGKLDMQETKDTANIWTTNQATLQAGVWSFTIDTQGGTNMRMDFSVQGHYSQTISTGGAARVEIGPIAVTSTSACYINIFPLSGGSDALVSSTRMTAARLAGPSIGQDVALQKCLPGQKIVDYLAGISHLFNLAWYYDSIKRILYVDPRHTFTIDGTTYDGFYAPASRQPDDWTKKIDVEQYTLSPAARPFGDFVTFSNQPEDSEWYKKLAGQGSTNSIPLAGASYRFSDTGTDGKNEENPYFEDLILVKNGTGSFENTEHMPLCLPEAEAGGAWPPVATYETTGPKYGYYAGDLANYAAWKWNGAIRSSRPVLYQMPPQNNTAGLTVCAAYGSYQTYGGSPVYIPGLAEVFRQQWLAILNKAVVMEADTWLQQNDVAPSPGLYMTPKKITIDQTTWLWVFLAAEQYHPLKDQASKVSYVQLVQVRADDQLRLVSSTKEPAIQPTQPT